MNTKLGRKKKLEKLKQQRKHFFKFRDEDSQDLHTQHNLKNKIILKQQSYKGEIIMKMRNANALRKLKQKLLL